MIREYLGAGLRLCAIKPNSKQPHGDDWPNKPITQPPPDGYGVGIIHRLNQTCAIDIDHYEYARLAIAGIDVDLDELLSAENAVQIRSRAGRAKLLYRFPEHIEAKRHNLNWPKEDDSRKRFCVLELRAGDVQDILPPTIHPETGKPYEWGGSGDWRNLPDLPEQLARAWSQWDLARDAMLDACPWRKTRISKMVASAPLANRGVRGGNVIGAFNDAYSPGEILERNEYRPAGRRWLSPHSETRIPGVVLLPESDPQCVFVHHASDPLSDGHKHDAFSLYTKLEHDGDVIAAVRAAADLMGIEREEDKEGAAIANRIMWAKVVSIKPPHKEQPETIELPNPGQIPCTQLRDIQEIVRSRVHAYKPDALTQATLSFACAVTARRYRTANGQPTTTFFGITDSSTAGLRPMKGALYSLADELGERAALRGTKIPSSGVFYAAMLAHPRMYWVTDEYGHIVRMAGRQQSGALESALAVLHEAHTGQTLYIDRDTATTNKARDIRDANIFDPAVTLLSLLHQDHLSALGSRQEYGRGTLQQMIVCHAGEATKHSGSEHKRPSEPLVEWVKRIQSLPGIPGAEQVATMPAKATTVHVTQDALTERVDAEKRMREFMDTDERAQYKGMVVGYLQSAMRIAASIAAWNNPDNPSIDAETARWALVWCERCLMQTVPRVVVTASDTDDPDVMQRVMQVLFDAERPMTAREIAKRCRAFRRFTGEDREQIMTTLADDGYCIVDKSGRAARYSAVLKSA